MGHERHASEDSLLSSLHLTILSLPTFSCQREQHRQPHQEHGYDGVISLPSRQKKKSPRPEQTLRIAPAPSSSPVPQPSRELWSMLRAGLLAHGSPYSPCLPICEKLLATSRQSIAQEPKADDWYSQFLRQWLFRVSSPFTAAGPRGRFTLFPYSERIMACTIGESGETCQVPYCLRSPARSAIAVPISYRRTRSL